MKKKGTVNGLLKWLKFNNETLMGIVAIVITLVYGNWGINLSKKQIELNQAQIKLSKDQEKTAVDLVHFSELLVKTDRVIMLSTEQLKLNKNVQVKSNTIYENTQIGNMNRLIETSHQISTEHLNLIHAHLGTSENELREYSRRLIRLKEFLVSEMGNPYLNSDAKMTELWSLAYANVGNLNQQIEFSLMNVGKKVLNLNTGKSEIGVVDTKFIENISV